MDRVKTGRVCFDSSDHISCALPSPEFMAGDNVAQQKIKTEHLLYFASAEVRLSACDGGEISLGEGSVGCPVVSPAGVGN